MGKKRKRFEEIQEDEKQKSQLGYQTAMNLVALVSEEIYSRFNAMLTANSIILAITGLILTSKSDHELVPFLLIFLPLVGLAFCILWLLFNRHGVYWQNRFRDEAIRLEKKYFLDTFKLITLVDTEDPSKKTQSKYVKNKLVKIFSYSRTSTYVIFIFIIIYIGIILYQGRTGILAFFGL